MNQIVVDADDAEWARVALAAHARHHVAAQANTRHGAYARHDATHAAEGARHAQDRRIAARGALAVPVTLLDVARGAAGGTSCKSGMRGVETWKPPLLASGSPHKTRPTITIRGAKLTGCKNGGVKSGTLSAKIKWLDPGNCDTLLTYREGEAFPRIKGTVTITWNTKETSTATVTHHAQQALRAAGERNDPTRTGVTGRVRRRPCSRRFEI